MGLPGCLKLPTGCPGLLLVVAVSPLYCGMAQSTQSTAGCMDMAQRQLTALHSAGLSQALWHSVVRGCLGLSPA